MEIKTFTAEEKLVFTSRLLRLLEVEMGTGDATLNERLEVLILAYHASTSTRCLRDLLSSR